MNDASGSYKLMIFLVITALVVALIYGSSSSLPLVLGQGVLPQEQENILQEQPQVVTNNTQVHWANYTNDKFGFSLEYPQSWIIREKQNRFETGAEAIFEHPDWAESRDDKNKSIGALDFVGAEPTPTSNIEELTNRLLQEWLELDISQMTTNIDSKRLIEDANLTRYKIDGERAGTFTFVFDKEDAPTGVGEFVTTIHNGKEYAFQFRASPNNFDNPILTNIKQHMFDSIKWLN